MHFSMLLCYIRKDLNFSWFFGYGRRLLILSVLPRRLFYQAVASTSATTTIYIFYLSDTISTNKLLIFLWISNIVVSSRVLPVVFFLPSEALQHYIIIVVSKSLTSSGAVGDLLRLTRQVAAVLAKILTHLGMIDSFFEVSQTLRPLLVASKASSALFFLLRSRLFFNLASEFFNVIVYILLQFGKIVLR